MPNNNAIYYSDGIKSYCHVSHPAFLSAPQSIRQISQSELDESGFSNAGICRHMIPTGLFIPPNKEAIFYSDGKSYYCKIPSPAFIKERYTGQKPREDIVDRRLSTFFENKGICL